MFLRAGAKPTRPARRNQDSNKRSSPLSTLTAAQRKRLRSLAHHLHPIVLIGKQGVTGTVIASVDVALEAHELIKIRFIEHKGTKKLLTAEIAEGTGSEIAGIIGHVAILYRRQEDPEKRHVDARAL